MMSNFITIFSYKDFLYQLVKKHFVNFYKQTILGPLLQVITPLLQSGIFTLVFSKLLDFNTDSVPPLLFYIICTTYFNYFRGSTMKCSNVYQSYQGLFRSFYFPKILMYISLILENFLLYVIQFFLLLITMFLYFFLGGLDKISFINILLSFIPIFYITFFSINLGIIFSSLSVKYRDLTHFVNYIMQILFYTTPILFSNSVISKDLEWFFYFNPIYYPISYYKNLLIGSQMPNITFLFSSLTVLIFISIISYFLYKFADKQFDDFI